MKNETIAKRYAKAIFAITKDEKIQDELFILTKICSYPKLKIFLKHPNIPFNNKIEIIEKICESYKINNVVKNLISILIKRKRIEYIENIYLQYKNMLYN